MGEHLERVIDFVDEMIDCRAIEHGGGWWATKQIEGALLCGVKRGGHLGIGHLSNVAEGCCSLDSFHR